MLRSALFAAVLTGMAAATATGASAWSSGGHGHDYRHRPTYHTSVQCIRGQKVLLKINQWGRVVDRTVIGRCGPMRHAWGRWGRW
jgi:hypothetical protein